MKRSLAVAMSVLAAFFVAPAFAGWSDPQAGHPALRVFSSADYGLSGKNQSLVRDRRGRLYVCSDQLVQYDGRSWTRIPINNAYELRSIALDEEDRLWICGVGELGYLDEDETGSRVYHSLNDKLPAGVSPNDPWNVFREKGRTLFVLTQMLLVWDGTQFETRSLPNSHRLYAFPYRDGVGIWQREGALWLWKGTTLEKILHSLPDDSACLWALGCKDGSELFGTRFGLLRLVGGQFSQLQPKPAQKFNQFPLNTGAVRLPDGSICVASLTSGLMLLDENEIPIRILDRKDGLPGIECEGLFLDRENGLWVSTRRNIFRLDARNAETLFDSANGLDRGAANVVVPHGDSIVTTGDESALILRTTKEGPANFAPIGDTRLVFNDVLSLPDGRLIQSTLGGIHAVPLTSYVELAGQDYTRLLLAGPESSVVLTSDKGQILAVDTAVPMKLLELPLPKLAQSPSDLALDHSGKLWAAADGGDLFSLHYPPQDLPIAPENWKPGRELPANFSKPKFFVLAQEAYVYAQGTTLRLTSRGDAVPTEVLHGLGMLTVERAGESEVWSVAAPEGSPPRLVHIERVGAELRVTAQECRTLHTIGNPLCIARDKAGKTLWIGGTSGLLRVEIASLAAEKKPLAPELMRVVWRSPQETHALPLRSAGQLAFEKDTTMEFDVRDARYVLDGPGRVEARLVGSDEKWTKAGLLVSYAGLREGNYRFEARALDLEGQPGPVLSYGFTINPPWQRSTWAYLAYGSCVVAVALVAIRIRTRRVARLNVQLEGLVTQRTEELTRAVAARSAFLANMGHEIRNPLNGVVGLVESLRADHLDSSQKQTVERLGSCAAQLVSVVEDVMEYARVDAGRVSLRQRAFALREPVDAAIDVLRAAAPQSVITLDATPSALDARVVGDPDRIRQIIVNYLANALKFGGGSPIEVALRRDGMTTDFAVTDHGPGIPADEQARLFVRFSRGSLAHQKAIPGTGLGLAACKAYAEAMGGEVGVESEPGDGATFFLRLPLPTATDADNEPTFVTPDIMVGRAALVVDDHEFNRIVLTDLLGRMGASAVSAPDIPTAREAFVARVPDVVFVDFDLAGLTGADLAQWIRNEAPVGRDVPIVATSAFEVDEVRRRCEEVGMDGFLVKPVTPQKIVTAMARIENIRGGGIISEEQPAPPANARVAFLDLLSDGDPKKRDELQREAWRVVMNETLNSTRALARGDVTEAGRAAHRLVPAGQMLGLRDVVAAAREINRAARADEKAAVGIALKRLRATLTTARRQLKG